MSVRTNEKFDDVLMDLDAVLDTHGVKADVTIQFGVSTSRIKPTGNLAYRQMTNEYCPTGCGCRLNTDGKIYWCSKTTCGWIGEAIK